jgi:Raf kinase inhibitor-like YbhB/YbcL family protein
MALVLAALALSCGGHPSPKPAPTPPPEADAAAVDVPPARDGAPDSGAPVDAAVDTTIARDAERDTAPPDAGASGPFALTSSAFKDGDMIATMYRCPPNPNISPPLSWTAGPTGTKSYVVTLAAGNTPHWQLWDIPGATSGLPEDVAKIPLPPVPPGAKQSMAGREGFGYIGPCPTTATVSRYTFTVHALGVATLGLAPQSAPADVTRAIAASSIASATLVVTGRN